MCPENVILKALIQNLLLQRKEAVIMDMEAGVEHLGRATAQAVDRLIVVVEPGKRSFETALRIKELAGDIKLSKVSLIVNKIRDENDMDFARKNSNGIPILGFINYDNGILKSDRERVPPWLLSIQSLETMRDIARILTEG